MGEVDPIVRASVALVEDLRRHDPSTRAHCERVASLAGAIGAIIGLTGDECEKLRLAALLHDIGKLAVPRHVLTKRGKPTAREWTLLRSHPDASRTLLESLEPWLGEWVAAATEHHERVDGRGYPNGLEGEEISLAGRIVAVARRV